MGQEEEQNRNTGNTMKRPGEHAWRAAIHGQLPSGQNALIPGIRGRSRSLLSRRGREVAVPFEVAPLQWHNR